MLELEWTDDSFAQELLDRLDLWGADVQGGMERFLYDEELYVKCIRRFAEDPAMEALKEAIQNKDRQAAYEAAHTLKGTSATLSLTPIYEAVKKIVDELNEDGDLTGFKEDFQKLKMSFQEYRSLLL
ncbi:MAG: Hpt domain-containing protein [Blautia sp.]|nr:Hpt domain-containing protein [Blautia sp.]